MQIRAIQTFSIVAMHLCGLLFHSQQLAPELHKGALELTVALSKPGNVKEATVDVTLTNHTEQPQIVLETISPWRGIGLAFSDAKGKDIFLWRRVLEPIAIFAEDFVPLQPGKSITFSFHWQYYLAYPPAKTKDLWLSARYGVGSEEVIEKNHIPAYLKEITSNKLRLRFSDGNIMIIGKTEDFGATSSPNQQPVRPRYKLTELPSLSDGDEAGAFGLNDKGQVVGYSSGRAVLWDKGKVIDLGTLGGEYSMAVAINNKGQVVGGADTRKGNHAFLWSDGVMKDLGGFGGVKGDDSDANDINDQGDIVGEMQMKSPTRIFRLVLHACLWRKGKIIDIGNLGGTQSSALSINSKGQIAGYSLTRSEAYHAVLWDRGKKIDLNKRLSQSGRANSINNPGQITGWVEDERISLSFVYCSGKRSFLYPPPGFTGPIASSINDSGDAVGSMSDKSHENRAFLSTKDSVYDLNDLTENRAGLVLEFARKINSSGQIAGTGRKAGHTHAFLLTPIKAD
jgi:probable HAF family extracellular repeat protein